MLPKKKGFHRHHIIPKHRGGTDDDSNIVYLTPEDHAKAHLELYEKYGHYEDAQAYNTLRRHWLEGRTLDGYKQSAEHIRKRIGNIDYDAVSRKLKGRVSPTKGLKFGTPSEETRRKISESNRGQKRSLECRKKISESRLGKPPSTKMHIYCIFCHNRVPLCKLSRHGPGKAACK
jgi:hypothetical protein